MTDTPHTSVSVTITDPTGKTHDPISLGSMPTWAVADSKALAQWKRSRRSVALDAICMSDRTGFRFAYTLVPDGVTQP